MLLVSLTALQLVCGHVTFNFARTVKGTVPNTIPLANGMVLQRAPLLSRVWGRTTKGEGETIKISVTTSDGKTLGNATAIARNDSSWIATLPPVNATTGAVVAAVDSDGISDANNTLRDVSFGDVCSTVCLIHWICAISNMCRIQIMLCSGQSNSTYRQ